MVQRPATPQRLRAASAREGVAARDRRVPAGAHPEVRRPIREVPPPFDVDRVRTLEPELPYRRPTRQRRGIRQMSTALIWAGGILVLVGVLLFAAKGADRWLGAGAATAGAAPPAQSVPASEFAIDGMPGSAARAQQLVRVRAEAFASCVFKAGGVASSGAPPYGRCDSARALGIDPQAISRRGKHGPIAGRGARGGLGLFTVHGEREAWLLQYDTSGRGWGYSFASDGTVAAQCRTVKGRLCWHLEDEPAGALFLGDDATVAALSAVLRGGLAGG